MQDPENTHPNDANAYVAKIVPYRVGTDVTQGVGSSPIQLTVSLATRLFLNVTRDKSSSNHMVQGRLMCKTSGVSNRTITIKINETDYTVQTNSTGYFRINPSLLPKDNKPSQCYLRKDQH